MFGGSPTPVAAPPMLDMTAVAISTGCGGMWMVWHRRMQTGVSSSMHVTLSRKAEATDTPMPSSTISFQGSPRDQRRP